jgi:hypothetical protein
VLVAGGHLFNDAIMTGGLAKNALVVEAHADCMGMCAEELIETDPAPQALLASIQRHEQDLVSPLTNLDAAYVLVDLLSSVRKTAVLCIVLVFYRPL